MDMTCLKVERKSVHTRPSISENLEEYYHSKRETKWKGNLLETLRQSKWHAWYFSLDSKAVKDQMSYNKV